MQVEETDHATISNRVSSLDERTAIIDERTSKLIDMVSILFNSVSGESLKRTQPDDEPDANKLIPANKKPTRNIPQ